MQEQPANPPSNDWTGRRRRNLRLDMTDDGPVTLSMQKTVEGDVTTTTTRTRYGTYTVTQTCTSSLRGIRVATVAEKEKEPGVFLRLKGDYRFDLSLDKLDEAYGLATFFDANGIHTSEGGGRGLTPGQAEQLFRDLHEGRIGRVAQNDTKALVALLKRVVDAECWEAPTLERGRQEKRKRDE